MTMERAAVAIPYTRVVQQPEEVHHVTYDTQSGGFNVDVHEEPSTLNGLRLVFSSEQVREYPRPVGKVDVSGESLNVMQFYDGEPGCAALMDRVVEGRHKWYVAHNLLNDDAPLDTIRGANVEVLAFTVPSTAEPVASLRKIHTQTPNDVPELPSFSKFNESDSLSEEGLQKLQLAMRRNDSVVEIGALWKDGAYGPDAALALYRTALHSSIKRRELWFMGVVAKQHKQLLSMFGPNVVQTIGEPVAIEGEGATDEAVIYPVLIEPQQVIGTLLSESHAAKANGDDVTRHYKDIMLWTLLEGLDWNELPAQTSADLRKTLYGTSTQAA